MNTQISLIGIPKPTFRVALWGLAAYALASLVGVSVLSRHPFGILPRARVTVLNAGAELGPTGRPVVTVVLRPERAPFYEPKTFAVTVYYKIGDQFFSQESSWKDLALLDEDPTTTPDGPIPLGRPLTFRIPLERADGGPVSFETINGGGSLLWGYHDLFEAFTVRAASIVP